MTDDPDRPWWVLPAPFDPKSPERAQETPDDVLYREMGRVWPWRGRTSPMKIETTVKGLTKAKRSKIDGLVAFDDTNDIACFEWRADQNPPHDYANAIARVRADVLDAGGEVGEFRIVG